MSTESFIELDGKRVPFGLIEGESIDDRCVRLARAVASVSRDAERGAFAAAVFWGGWFKGDDLTLDEVTLLLDGFAPPKLAERWSNLTLRIREAAKAGAA